MEDKFEDACALFCDAVGEMIGWPFPTDTPERMARAYREILTPEPFTKPTFTYRNHSPQHGFLVLHPIPFVCFCDHHMLPYLGDASIGVFLNMRRGVLVSGGETLGLSKAPRIIRSVASFPQMQESLTAEIAHQMEEYLQRDVVVRTVGRHLCVCGRGVRDTETLAQCYSMSEGVGPQQLQVFQGCLT